MTEDFSPLPGSYSEIQKATLESGFTMASDLAIGSLLRTLAVSKPGGRFLELGTGTGLSTSWILEGMDHNSRLTTIDNDVACLSIAQKYLGNDPRLNLQCIDGEDWINSNLAKRFDLIFADTWHGKYLMLDPILEMLKPGGFYIVDDMNPQPNWPEGHAEKAEKFIEKLNSSKFLALTKMNWSTGIILATRKY
ncbi:MAG TPA: class I SAM-dependent methyltransferase [Algoriphagus sp.]|nr:class I SAM-dependent methyltransferase [Algoriphagus sp.]